MNFKCKLGHAMIKTDIHDTGGGTQCDYCKNRIFDGICGLFAEEYLKCKECVKYISKVYVCLEIHSNCFMKWKNKQFTDEEFKTWFL